MSCVWSTETPLNTLQFVHTKLKTSRWCSRRASLRLLLLSRRRLWSGWCTRAKYLTPDLERWVFCSIILFNNTDYQSSVTCFSFSLCFSLKCIDNHAREKNIHKSLDLPDKTLQFIRDKPLMDQAVKAIGERPLLAKTGIAFTRIVVATATALNGSSHQVMFIGTSKDVFM